MVQEITFKTKYLKDLIIYSPGFNTITSIGELVLMNFDRKEKGVFYAGKIREVVKIL